MTMRNASASQWGSYSVASLINAIVVLCSAGAAAIHFAVLGDHFNESWLYGMFFAVVAWLQVVWAFAVLREPSQRLYWAGAAGNAAVIAIWVVTRTLGVPVGPAVGEVEPAGVADIFATLFEGVIVLAAVTLSLQASKGAEDRAVGGFWFVVGVAAIAVAVATTFSLVDLASGEEAGSGHGETTSDGNNGGH